MTHFQVIALNFDTTEGPKIEQAIEEANQIINEIQKYDFTAREEEAVLKLDRAQELKKQMNDFNQPVQDQHDEYEKLKQDIEEINNKLNDISNYTQTTFTNTKQVEELHEKYRGDMVKGKIDTIHEQSKKAIDDLEKAHELLTLATENLASAHRSTNKLEESQDTLETMYKDLNNYIEDSNQIDPLEEALSKANNHSLELSLEVIIFFIWPDLYLILFVFSGSEV